jgi:anti-sigma-K factor RskA
LDIQAYISSGILEQYVLGMTSPAETEEVERLAAQYPQIRAEIVEISTSLESYAQHFSQTPPAFLKDKIWEALDNSSVALSPESDVTPDPIPQNAPVADQAFVQIERAPFWQTYGVAASFILLALSILVNLYLFSQLKRTEDLLSRATEDRSQLANQLEINQASFTDLQSTLSFYRNPKNRIIQLTGNKDTAGAGVVVFWNQKENQVAVTIQNMPPPPPGQQYQLWAIVDKKPVDAGVFNAGIASVQNMKNIAKAQAFAITLEKEGGSPQPTGSILMLAEV